MRLHLRSQAALAAETLFLKTQLALYQDLNPRWQCDSNVTRFTLVWLSDWFDWHPLSPLSNPRPSSAGDVKAGNCCGRRQLSPDDPPSPRNDI